MNTGLPPRIGAGMFNMALQTLFTKLNGYPIDFTEYGKPFPSTYKFVESLITQKRCYMIGDNLNTDIKGANGRKNKSEKEWTTIVVKTGIY